MDKNMINIDDLFRQRMSGREEPERAGAWTRMSELLDKEEETRPVGFGWKRFAGVLAGLVFVSAISVGGYMAINNGNSAGRMTTKASEGTSFASGATGTNTLASTVGDNGKSTSTAIPANGSITRNATGSITNTSNKVSKDATTSANSAVAATNNTNARTSTSSDNSVRTNDNSRNTSAGNLSRNNNDNSGANSALSSSQNNVAHLSNTTANNADNSTVNSNNSIANEKNSSNTMQTGNAIVAANAANGLVANNTVSARAGSPSTATTGAQIASNKDNDVANSSEPVDAIASNTALNTASKAKTDKSTATQSKRDFAVNEKLSSTNNLDVSKIKVQPNRFNTTTSANINTERNLVANDNTYTRKDTIQKITLVYHYALDPYTHKRFSFVDTESVEKILIERTIPFASSIMVANAKEAAVPYTGADAVAAESKADAGDEIVPLANFKVASKKKKWNPEVFTQVFETAKMNVLQARMYPGVSAGINSFFTQGLMPGLNIGVNNEIVFNDRWSIMTELKYLINFNNGKSVRDNYVTAPTSETTVYSGTGSAVGKLYERDSVDHYFKFSAYGSLNLPISVRYSYKRFFFATGLNFVYTFKMNVEEKEERYVLQDTYTLDQSPDQYFLKGTNAKIGLSDFGGRFGMGYMFNAGYHLTPAFSLDLRFTQTFWDNAGTPGAERVSSQLFKMPSTQFSLSYRFGQLRR